MKLRAGLLVPPRMQLHSSMQLCASGCWPLPMTPHVCCLLVLSGLAVSSQLGLEDVFFSPEDQTVGEGEAVFLQCVSGESSPPASITWLKDGNLVRAGRHVQGEYGGGRQKKTSATLHLFNVTLEDEGTYVCDTHNHLLNISKKSKPAKLTVQGVPRRLRIIQGPDNITVAIGTAVSMHCAVRGYPVPMVHWFKDGCLLTNCSAWCSLQNNGQLLTFRNVSSEDEGSYHCEASNQEETIKSQPAFLHPAVMDWSFVQQPSSLTARRGDNVTLTCRPPSSRPAALVSWFRNNRLLTITTNTTVLSSGDLLFHSVQEDDSGSYFCRASNIHLQRFVTSRRATLTVLAPPVVKLWPQVLTVPVGARVVLECRVSGHPLPSVSWVKRGHSKQTGGKVALGMRNTTLHIQSARSYDEGVYVCEASNAVGRSRGTALLTVAVSPVIVTSVGHVTCRPGAPAVLPCRAVGVQPITYTWSRGRAGAQSPISATQGRFIHEDGALHISSVQNSDAGEYQCTAENRAGRHQRRTVLTLTADDQTGLLLSASTSVRKGLAATLLKDSVADQLSNTEYPRVQPQRSTYNSATIFPTLSRKAFGDLKMPLGSFNHVSQPLQSRPTTTSPTQPLITQMQPPILPPPPHPHFQSAELLPKISRPLFITKTRPPVAHSPRPDSYSAPIAQVTQMQESSSKLPTEGSLGSLEFDRFTQSPVTGTVMGRSASDAFTVTSQHKLYPSEAESHQPVTNNVFPPSHHDTSSFQSSPTEINPLLPFPTPSPKPQTHSQHSSAMSFIPRFHLELSTIRYHFPPTKPASPSNTEPRPTNGHHHLSSNLTFSELPQSQTEISPTQHLQSPSSTQHSSNQPNNSSTLSSKVLHQVNQSDQLNETQNRHPVQSAKPANDTDLTDWLKRNTSQSPMTSNDPRVTQRSPSWLPVLEKHDIPIVVGVGVSLAFIFITVTFYSVVQKNEPAPTSRAGSDVNCAARDRILTAQRHLGVPKRHGERRATGRTYENRAFEDDECVAVIEQSPNQSDTRARPPGPSLVTVQMEPTAEDRPGDTQPPVDNHSVIVETYPEPIVDTKIDPSLEEEKGRSLSQPSIQLHCTEDWTSNPEDDHSPCQDALPPPSSFTSRSPSPSPPCRREEGLHSSLTLHSAEPCGAPIHHSLSISRGNPPLLLTHHVSMGLTTVAVDVHFYPAATSSSMAVGSSTHISSVSNSSSVTAPLFSPPLVTSHDNHQPAAMFQPTK